MSKSDWCRETNSMCLQYTVTRCFNWCSLPNGHFHSDQPGQTPSVQEGISERYQAREQSDTGISRCEDRNSAGTVKVCKLNLVVCQQNANWSQAEINRSTLLHNQIIRNLWRKSPTIHSSLLRCACFLSTSFLGRSKLSQRMKLWLKRSPYQLYQWTLFGTSSTSQFILKLLSQKE